MPHAGRSSTSALPAAPHAIWRDPVARARRTRARHHRGGPTAPRSRWLVGAPLDAPGGEDFVAE